MCIKLSNCVFLITYDNYTFLLIFPLERSYYVIQNSLPSKAEIHFSNSSVLFTVTQKKIN